MRRGLGNQLWEIINLPFLFPFPETGFPLLKPAVISQLEGGGELEGPSPLASAAGTGLQGLWTGKGGTHCPYAGK